MDFLTRYMLQEKIILDLVIATTKLMHYFQAHPMAVDIELPLKNMLMKVDLSGTLSKWVVELGQFDIKFLPKEAIKG